MYKLLILSYLTDWVVTRSRQNQIFRDKEHLYMLEIWFFHLRVKQDTVYEQELRYIYHLGGMEL